MKRGEEAFQGDELEIEGQREKERVNAGKGIRICGIEENGN